MIVFLSVLSAVLLSVITYVIGFLHGFYKGGHVIADLFIGVVTKAMPPKPKPEIKEEETVKIGRASCRERV